jgi:hypothetical protein
LAIILAASTVVMALPFETAKASRGGDSRAGRGGDAETGDFESYGDDNIGNTAVGGDADSEATGGAGGTATGGDDTSTDASE